MIVTIWANLGNNPYRGLNFVALLRAHPVWLRSKNAETHSWVHRIKCKVYWCVLSKLSLNINFIKARCFWASEFHSLGKWSIVKIYHFQSKTEKLTDFCSFALEEINCRIYFEHGFFGTKYQFQLLLGSLLHSLKSKNLAAHLEVDKCLNIFPIFQTILALSFGHYIKWICKFADWKKILYRCITFLVIFSQILSIWHLPYASMSSLFLCVL